MKKLLFVLTSCAIIGLNIMSCATSKGSVKAQSAATETTESFEPTEESGLKK